MILHLTAEETELREVKSRAWRSPCQEEAELIPKHKVPTERN